LTFVGDVNNFEAKWAEYENISREILPFYNELVI
jgi:hypothetical protein